MKSKFLAPDQWDITDVDGGWGAAVNAGWRDLGWSVGASMITRRRDNDEGADASTFGVYGVVNPWRYWKRWPVTYQAEFDFGTWQRAGGTDAEHAAFYQEVDWVAFNGIVLLMAHDWADPDREVKDDEDHRVQAGMQITPYPGRHHRRPDPRADAGTRRLRRRPVHPAARLELGAVGSGAAVC